MLTTIWKKKIKKIEEESRCLWLLAAFLMPPCSLLWVEKSACMTMAKARILFFKGTTKSLIRKSPMQLRGYRVVCKSVLAADPQHEPAKHLGYPAKLLLPSVRSGLKWILDVILREALLYSKFSTKAADEFHNNFSVWIFFETNNAASSNFAISILFCWSCFHAVCIQHYPLAHHSSFHLHKKGQHNKLFKNSSSFIFSLRQTLTSKP